MKRTLKNTLLSWFLIFSVFVIVVLLGSNALYINQKSKITDALTRIYLLHLDIQKDFNLTDAFFTYEANNPVFYERKESSLLDEHHTNIKDIYIKITEISATRSALKMEIRPTLDSLLIDVKQYDSLYNRLVELVVERGFKDEGIVGTMRRFVHKLENIEELDQTYVLGMRRHEKDYIIRGEQEYILKLNSLADDFKLKVLYNKSISDRKKEEIIHIISSYQNEFSKLVEVDREIGIRIPESGKKLELNELEKNIEERFSQIITRAETKKRVLLNYLEAFYIFFYLIFLLISVFFSQIISKKISAPLAKLTAHIKLLSENNLKLNDRLDQTLNNYETSILYQEFRLLIERIKKEKEDLHRVQVALIENEEKYRQLADNLPQAVFETDQFGNLTYVNSSWLKAFLYSSQDVEEGLNIINILKAESGPIVLGEESGSSMAYIAVRKDNSTFPSMVYTNRIHRDNKLKGFRGAIIDVTGRVQKKSRK
jgi:PAS domain S-box-containing protein